MTEAAGAAVRFGFGPLALHKITTGCVADNAASKRVIEKLGFRSVGTQREHLFRHGRWWDHLEFELLDTEFRSL
jgi:RimJ/RimL family protein N-acetyltransferase